jgi:TolB-like protein/DNA-binding winged helix-turn-helix (wHTH) protein/Flp pilus assembly protein TadD
MEALAKGDISRFEGFRLDRQARTLLRRDEGGGFVPVALGSRAFDVLDVLVKRAGDLVSRNEFMAAVWPATAVEETNLNMQISALRRVLDEGRTEGSCIQTVPGRGYRFALPVTLVESAVASASGRRSGNGAGGPVAGQLEALGPAASSQLPPQVVGDMAGSSAPAAWRSPQPAVAPRLSIAVLPFTHPGSNPEEQYFAEAITEDLTTDLSRIAGMLVISRNTAFTYQGKRVDTKQIGRELRVRYVVEGSVQRSDNRVRVNAQLIDAETDAHLWAERFASDTSDLFTLQDEITSRIAISLNLELLVAEAARPTQNLDALDLVLRGRSVLLRLASRDSYDEAIRLFQRAVELDPGSVEAQSFLADALAQRRLDFGSGSLEVDMEQADALSSRALMAAPRNPLAHYARGQVLRAQGRLEEAIAEYEIVLACDRNHVAALSNIGRCRINIGPIEDCIVAQQQAIRLSPRHPRIYGLYSRMGLAHLLQSRFEEGIFWYEKARDLLPGFPVYRAYLAAAYALHGDVEQAAAELAEAQRLDGTGNFTSIAREKRRVLTYVPGLRPEIRALYEATYFAGLRLAGMPEE